jgi:exonuclease SbcD
MADLHIGKSVNGFSMLEEQRHVFAQIIGYIKSERPTAVVIAGDIYDRAVPGVEAVRLCDDFLTELAEEGVAIMLISGNHDSPERISYASRLLSDRRLFLHGAPDGGIRSVTLADEFGEVRFWLLPFVRPSNVRRAFDECVIESYSDALASILGSADIDLGVRNVLVSHQFFTAPGLAPIRSESEMNPVGGLDAIDAGLAGRFDYVALGHLHRAQNVGTDKIRYAGSPLKYSFSEWRHDKSVTLVDLKDKGSLAVTALPLTPIHDLREIKGKLEVLTGDEVSSQGDKEDYLRVVLTDEEEIIDPMGKVRAVYPNVMALDFENSRTSVDISAVNPASEETGHLSPYDLFSEFFLDVNGAAMSVEQAKIVVELLEAGEQQ